MKQYLSIALAVVIIALPGLTLSGGCSAPSPQLEAKAAIIDQLYVLEKWGNSPAQFQPAEGRIVNIH